MERLPLAKVPYKDMTTIGKVKYGFTFLSAVIGVIFGLWQGTVFAGERANLYVKEVVYEEAYAAVSAPVESKLSEVQKQNQVYYLMNQMQGKQLELRAIESEIRDITRAVDTLSPTTQAEIQQLRDDRIRVQRDIHQLQNNLSNITQ